MRDLHPPILQLLGYYARKTNSQPVLAILAKRDIDDEAEAKELLAFLDVMSDAIAVDAKSQVAVLENEHVHTSDAVKVSEVIESYLEARGYGHLLPDD